MHTPSPAIREIFSGIPYQLELYQDEQDKFAELFTDKTACIIKQIQSEPPPKRASILRAYIQEQNVQFAIDAQHASGRIRQLREDHGSSHRAVEPLEARRKYLVEKYANFIQNHLRALLRETLDLAFFQNLKAVAHNSEHTDTHVPLITEFSEWAVLEANANVDAELCQFLHGEYLSACEITSEISNQLFATHAEQGLFKSSYDTYSFCITALGDLEHCNNALLDHVRASCNSPEEIYNKLKTHDVIILHEIQQRLKFYISGEEWLSDLTRHTSRVRQSQRRMITRLERYDAIIRKCIDHLLDRHLRSLKEGDLTFVDESAIESEGKRDCL